MFAKQNTDWNLLAKFLAGETGAEENAAIGKWMGKSPENRTLFGKLKSDWKIMDNMNKQFNVDNAWNKVYGRIAAHDGIAGTISTETGIVQHRKFWLTPFRVAASLLLIAAVGVAVVFITGRNQRISVSTASNDRQRSIILPDGSTIFMNANTHLSYAKDFGQKVREVTLSGEAFFEVAPDKTKPFMIHANDADIKVVGTSFNIDTRNRDKGVEVYVSTGIVEVFRSGADNHVLLQPGDLGLIGREGISHRKSENKNPIAWKTGNMDFRDTRLTEAVQILNEIYRVNIICREPGLDTTQTNGTYRYPDESLDQILTILCTQNHLKIEKSDQTIYLTR
jgi:transmembrane sensor